MYLQWLHVDYSESGLTATDAKYQMYALIGISSLRGLCETYPMGFKHINQELICPIYTPEKDSFSEKYFDDSLKQIALRLKNKNINYSIELIGEEDEAASLCHCANSSVYMLCAKGDYSTEIITCMDCNGVVPLYKLPLDARNNNDLFHWSRIYMACRDLHTTYSNLNVLKFESARELSNPYSNLNKEGLACRDMLATLTNKPVYYYLPHDRASCVEQDLARKCPLCGNKWLIKDEGLGWIGHDFRCDHCHLFSNLADFYDF